MKSREIPRQAEGFCRESLRPATGWMRALAQSCDSEIATNSRRPADSLSKSRRAGTQQHFGNINFFRVQTTQTPEKTCIEQNALRHARLVMQVPYSKLL